MWSWLVPSGGTRGRAKSSTGCPSKPASWSASRVDIMQGTRWSSTASPTRCPCCRRAWKLSVIGNGVVIDPRALLEEIDRLKGQGIEVTPQSLRIAENATLILPLHQELDAVRESSNTLTRVGTTRRGIGPAYEDKVGRRAIRVMDLADPLALGRKIERLLAHHNALRRGLGLEEVGVGTVREQLESVAPRVLPYMDSVWSLLDRKRREGKRILFEGAQGALLDIDHGTYPFVTSSNTVAAQAATGSGLG